MVAHYSLVGKYSVFLRTSWPPSLGTPHLVDVPDVMRHYFPSNTSVCAAFKLMSYGVTCVCAAFESADIMVGLGYSRESIQESLARMKYDEITATYLLLGRKSSEVRTGLQQEV